MKPSNTYNSYSGHYISLASFPGFRVLYWMQTEEQKWGRPGNKAKISPLSLIKEQIANFTDINVRVMCRRILNLWGEVSSGFCGWWVFCSKHIVQYCWERYQYKYNDWTSSLSYEVPGRSNRHLFPNLVLVMSNLSTYYAPVNRTWNETGPNVWTMQSSNHVSPLPKHAFYPSLKMCALLLSCHSPLSVPTTWFLLGVASLLW